MISPTDLKFLRWYNDPGHGWLGVPVRILMESGVAREISQYSYIDGAMAVAYLEEDCDAPKFLAAIDKQGDEFEEEHLTDSQARPCFIRRLHPYVAAEVMGPVKGGQS